MVLGQRPPSQSRGRESAHDGAGAGNGIGAGTGVGAGAAVVVCGAFFDGRFAGTACAGGTVAVVVGDVAAVVRVVSAGATVATVADDSVTAVVVLFVDSVGLQALRTMIVSTNSFFMSATPTSCHSCSR